MEGVSEQIQQLGLYQRSRLICCLILTLFMLCMILALVIILICIDGEKIINSVPERLTHEYVYVIRLNESWTLPTVYKYKNHTTI